MVCRKPVTGLNVQSTDDRTHTHTEWETQSPVCLDGGDTYEERFVFKTEASQKELRTLARAAGLISGDLQETARLVGTFLC